MARGRLRKIKIEWKRLTQAWGYAYPDEHRIELDPRMNDKLLLEIASHEAAHIAAPYLDEAAVDLIGRQIGDVLHRIGFRRIEESEDK